MKNKVLSLVVIFFFGTLTLFAQSETKEFKVSGNCGMCESRIETAAKSVEGVSKADWNKDTKMLKITFDKLKTNEHKVHLAVSKVGHDTDMHKAEVEIYNALPGCCKYERSTSKKEKHSH